MISFMHYENKLSKVKLPADLQNHMLTAQLVRVITLHGHFSKKQQNFNYVKDFNGLYPLLCSSYFQSQMC